MAGLDGPLLESHLRDHPNTDLGLSVSTVRRALPSMPESLNKRADGTCWEPFFRTHFWLDKRLAN
jgi:hypothetical protein